MNLRCVEMRFILLAISLLFANTTYAAIVNNFYIYSDDSDKRRADKEEYRIAKDEIAQQQLMAFKKNRKNSYQHFAEDEVVYRVGDSSKKDVGTKIGMTKDQVINNSYWGKPDNIYTIIDGNDKLELWSYEIHGERNRISKIDGSLFFINGKLTHRTPIFKNGEHYLFLE